MKEIKLGILDEIKKMMGDRMADKVGKPKAVSVEVSAMSPKMAENSEVESDEEEDDLKFLGDGFMEQDNEDKGILMEQLKKTAPKPPAKIDEGKLSPEEMSQLKSLYEKMMG